MRIAVFMSSDGRSGKSLLADELAFSLERTNIPCWFHTAKNSGTIHRSRFRSNAEVLIVDVGGMVPLPTIAQNEALHTLLRAANLVVIPRRSSMVFPSDVATFVTAMESAAGAVHKMNPDAAVLLVHNYAKSPELSKVTEAAISERMPWAHTLSLRQMETVHVGKRFHRSGTDFMRHHPDNIQLATFLNTARQHLGVEVELALKKLEHPAPERSERHHAEQRCDPRPRRQPKYHGPAFSARGGRLLMAGIH